MSESIRILIASDVHAGYGENKKGYETDSFDGLEETLQHANDQDVDFILLGGDLFHESVPTRFTEHKVISLLRKYCLNDREVAIEMVSDPTEVFENSQFKLVNYEDPNMNIGMPIFSIHGNHDDFSGKGLMALDILHDAGLVNLFGKFVNLSNMKVKPVLLKKGNVKVALYGIGSQRDDRLQRAFHDKKIEFCYPEDVEEWFNILVVHQNRPPRSMTRTTGSYLPLNVLPSQMDLIIWGHEHKCEIEPQFYEKGTGDPNDGFFIIQPGSTVATSMCPDETFPKHCGVLTIKGKTFKQTPIPLERTRQIYIDELDLVKVEPNPRPLSQKTKARTSGMHDEIIIKSKIENILKRLAKDRSPTQPECPRVRLKVIYSGPWLEYPVLNPRQVGMKFEGRVANPSDMVSIKNIKKDAEEEEVDERGEPIKVTRDTVTVTELLDKALKKDNVGREFGVISLITMQDYVNLATKLDKAKKKDKYQLLEDTVELQCKNFHDKISSIQFPTNEKNPITVELIQKTINRAMEVMRQNHQEKQRELEELEEDGEGEEENEEDETMEVDDVKEEVESLLEEQENSYPGLQDDDD